MMDFGVVVLIFTAAAEWTFQEYILTGFCSFALHFCKLHFAAV